MFFAFKRPVSYLCWNYELYDYLGPNKYRYFVGTVSSRLEQLSVSSLSWGVIVQRYTERLPVHEYQQINTCCGVSVEDKICSTGQHNSYLDKCYSVFNDNSRHTDSYQSTTVLLYKNSAKVDPLYLPY